MIRSTITFRVNGSATNTVTSWIPLDMDGGPFIVGASRPALDNTYQVEYTLDNPFKGVNAFFTDTVINTSVASTVAHGLTSSHLYTSPVGAVRLKVVSSTALTTLPYTISVQQAS